jgi:hypothetical protein
MGPTILRSGCHGTSIPVAALADVLALPLHHCAIVQCFLLRYTV